MLLVCLDNMLDPIDTEENCDYAPLVVEMNPPAETPSTTPPVFYGVGFITDVPTIEINVAPRNVLSQ